MFILDLFYLQKNMQYFVKNYFSFFFNVDNSYAFLKYSVFFEYIYPTSSINHYPSILEVYYSNSRALFIVSSSFSSSILIIHILVMCERLHGHASRSKAVSSMLSIFLLWAWPIILIEFIIVSVWCPISS